MLRIRTAITDIVPSKPALNTITSIGPPGLVISTVKKITTGVHAFVGEATLEAEFLDSVTNEQLAAALDRRGALKVKVFKGMSKWGHVKVVFEEWALMLRQKLDEAHGKPVKGIYEPIKQ
ncbi:MAG TPA: DUF3313 domain-containing protein [Nitrospinota bacterium]|nr:DUF3313 domain-containing protein [Nitrospinota bacterium]